MDILLASGCHQEIDKNKHRPGTVQARQIQVNNGWKQILTAMHLIIAFHSSKEAVACFFF